MTVAIYGRKVTKPLCEQYIHVINSFEKLGSTVILEEELQQQLIQKAGFGEGYSSYNSHQDFVSGVDLMISMGGDGTFIKAVNYIRSSEVPILGINTGRLGFLANISIAQIENTLDRIYRKEYEYQKRSLLRVHTDEDIFGDENFALNELTLHKKDTSSMITVHASLDNKYLNSYWADGLIVSTPTGSTAYNLSCGGPIITPGCQVHILTPIAPHNLNVRPMVVPDHLPISLEVEGRDRTYLLSIDGNSKSIRQGEQVILRKAEFMINVVKFEDNNFLDTIRNKMLWGIDTRN
ncbi:MAG: hypothetical protein RL264_819 [Bacteroidota bacterium]|jgi:NAD+ kinase